MQVVATPLDEYFRLNVRLYRTQKGLTQLQLADRLGVKQPVIAAIEAGRSTPGLDVVSRVAEALGVPANLLLTQPEENLSHSA